jgi:alpha-tubulin suppressor-like RCC1 family protein
VTYASCGEKHSVVVTLEGGVFSFGSSMYGQLGHNSTNDELLPRKISELMGSEVSQIACGRYFTLENILPLILLLDLIRLSTFPMLVKSRHLA